MSEILVILIKEFKSMIRDPKILIAMFIVPFIITGGMYYAIIHFTQQAVRETIVDRGTILVVDNDRDYWSRNLIEYLKKNGYEIVMIDSREELMERIRENSSLRGLIIPNDFSRNISSNTSAYVELYLSIKSPSISSITNIVRLHLFINDYSRNLSRVIVEKYGLEPNYVFNPIYSTSTIMIRDYVINIQNPEIITSIVSVTSLLYPVLILVLASFLTQLTATSIAVEKEEKMLETILSLPVSRFKFILTKIIASVTISLIALAVYSILFIWFFTVIGSVSVIEAEQANRVDSLDVSKLLSVFSKIFSFGEIALLIINLVVFILFILGLSIVLSLFTEDVRSAQIVTQYLITPLIFIIFINMYVDLSVMSPLHRYMLSIIPIVNTGFTPLYLFINDYVSIYLTILSTLLYAVVSIYIASKLVGSEKIFTARLLRRFKK